jgi:nucleotide-binding universal stress UspA family protein
MLKLLIPVDGSKSAIHAVQYAVHMLPLVRDMEAHLLNVQEKIDSWEVRSHMDTAEISDLQRCRADEALKESVMALQAAGIKYHTHIGQGEVSATIANFAEKLGCHQIVMGTRGMGALEGLLMGSVSTKVLNRVKIPVTLVK